MITVGEAIKELINKGFVELNWVGSHRKFGKGDKRITIVYHKSPKEELHPKTKKQLQKLLTDL